MDPLSHANLPHSLIKWLIVTFLSPHNQYLSFCCVLSIIIILLFWKFFTPALDDGFYWSLSDSKSLQVSRTLLSILVNLNNVLVWMISIHPLIFKSSSPCTNLLLTVPGAPIAIGIVVTFIFNGFFQFFSKVCVLISLLLSFSFTLWSAVTAMSAIQQVLFSLVFFFFFFLLDCFILFFVVAGYHYVWSSDLD